MPSRANPTWQTSFDIRMRIAQHQYNNNNNNTSD